MARPKKDIDSLKAIQVNVRITMKEYLMLSKNADVLGIKISDYIRTKISGEVILRTRISIEDRRLFTTLSRIGNNINQLTKKAHSGVDIHQDLHHQLIELRDGIEIIKAKIKNK